MEKLCDTGKLTNVFKISNFGSIFQLNNMSYLPLHLPFQDHNLIALWV